MHANADTVDRPFVNACWLFLIFMLAVHRPFYISICISTLPTQHTTFIFYQSICIYINMHKKNLYFFIIYISFIINPHCQSPWSIPIVTRAERTEGKNRYGLVLNSYSVLTRGSVRLPCVLTRNIRLCLMKTSYFLLHVTAVIDYS